MANINRADDVCLIRFFMSWWNIVKTSLFYERNKFFGQLNISFLQIKNIYDPYKWENLYINEPYIRVDSMGTKMGKKLPDKYYSGKASTFHIYLLFFDNPNLILPKVSQPCR